jgi:hypothetical protein
VIQNAAFKARTLKFGANICDLSAAAFWFTAEFTDQDAAVSASASK